MYYLYGKLNRGHRICPLYGGCPLLGESVIRGFTVYTCGYICVAIDVHGFMTEYRVFCMIVCMHVLEF